MQCMKCGRETQNEANFCSLCLEEMAKKPVNSQVKVIIPTRDIPSRKASSSRQQKQNSEEIIEKLQQKIHRLHAWIIFLLLLLSAVCGFVGWQYFNSEDGPIIGQNYSTVSSTTEATGGN